MIENSFYNMCKEYIKKEEFKEEIKEFMKPFIKIILQEINPYIYLSVLLVFISFFLLLGIFFMLVRTKFYFKDC